MVEVYLIFHLSAVEGMQCKSRTQYRIERCVELRKGPALKSVIADCDRAVLMLERNDGIIGAVPTLVIHDCYARVWKSSVSLT